MTLNLDSYRKIIEEALSYAKKQGATSAEVGLSLEQGSSLHIQQDVIDKMEYHLDKSFSITVYQDHRKAQSIITDFSPSAIEQAIRNACDRVRFTEADPASGLADADRLAKKVPDLDLYHPWSLTQEEKIQLALHNAFYAKQLDPRIVNVEEVSLISATDYYGYGNSLGFIGLVPSSFYQFNCSVIAKDSNSMERDADFTLHRDPQLLIPFEKVVQRAVERATARLHPRKISTGSYPVLFKADIASSLLDLFVSAIYGTALYRKTSFLVDHLGKTLFSPFVKIYERPYLLKGFGSAAFDADGVATTDKDFVTAGVLKSYVLSSYSARKLGLETTGNAGGVHNLFIETGALDFSALLKKMDRGLLVTELMGSEGINLTTGDYSQGVAGFWIEGGQIQYPVSEITIGSNLRDMFKNFIALGNDVDTRGNIQTGSILIESMTIAGQ